MRRHSTGNILEPDLFFSTFSFLFIQSPILFVDFPLLRIPSRLYFIMS